MSRPGPAGAGWDPVEGRRPLGWLMWLFLLGAVGWAVTAMLVADRRGALLLLAGGFLVAGMVTGIIGGALARRAAASRPAPGSAVATGTAATTSAFDQPAAAVAPGARMPGVFGWLSSWGVGSFGRLATMPARMLRLFGLFFLLDAVILVGLAVAFPSARPALIFGAVVLVVMSVGAMLLLRKVGALLGGLAQGGEGSTGDDGAQDLGSIAGLVRLARSMSGAVLGAGSAIDLGGGATVDLGAASAVDPAVKAHLDEKGVSATGTVEEVTDTGVLVNAAHVLAVTLSVDVPNVGAVTSRTAAIVPEATAARLVKGARVPVRIDPADPQVIRAEWDRA